ncbi:MAG TPA: hypothetical protein VNJ70_12830 [Thermoanaerobaculia bacterium]|nr:hypothetical protein [Thermoanaerobaculia bacterium]
MSRIHWTVLAAVALPVLLVLACAKAPQPEGQYEPAAAKVVDAACDATPRNHVIEVGAQVSCKDPHVSKSNGNQITWRSVVVGSNLEVKFKPKAGVDPFPSLSCPGNTPVCNSGPIAAAANGAYDYDVWLVASGGAKTPIDPGVIIDP